MINVYKATSLDLTLLEKDLAESHGGTVEDMRTMMRQEGMLTVSFFDENTILAMLGVTKPDEDGVCGLCTLYTNSMMEAPIKSVKAARSAINTLMTNPLVKGLKYAIPSSSATGPRFSAILGFTKVSEVKEYDIYYRGE